MAEEFAEHPIIHEILDFIRERGDRAICMPWICTKGTRCNDCVGLTPEGRFHENGGRPRDLREGIARLCRCSRIRPMLGGFRSEEAQCAAGDEVTLEVEGVVDGGVCGEEALRRSRRLEPLHLPFSSPHRLV